MFLFCLFFSEPNCPSHGLHKIIVIFSPQGDGSSRLLWALDSVNNATGAGYEHDNSTIMLIFYCQIWLNMSLYGASVIMVGSVMFYFSSVPSKYQTAPGWAVQYSFSSFLCSLASSLSRPAWRSQSSKLSFSKDLQELVSCERLALIPPNLFKKTPVHRFKLVPN